MTSGGKQYGREDILHFKNCKSTDFQVINADILKDISVTQAESSSKHNGLHNKKTKRGCRAGKRKQNQKLLSWIKPSHHLPTISDNTNDTNKNATNKKGRIQLPSILYTNCRSLNTWKLAELQVYAESHHPDIICLTETWLDDNKQQTITIDGYNNYFSHRKDRIGGGVGILVHHNIKATLMSSYTSRTMSAVWVMLDITSCSPVIMGCIYHPPNTD